MTLLFPHEDGCPTCASTCDDIEVLRRQNRLLRFVALGSLWIAASSTRSTASDLETVEQVRQLAFEAVETASLLDLDADMLDLLFPRTPTK